MKRDMRRETLKDMYKNMKMDMKGHENPMTERCKGFETLSHVPRPF